MQPTPSDGSSSLRPHLTVVFAIVIIWFAGKASAQAFDSPVPCCDGGALELVGAPPIQFDAQTMFDYPARIEVGTVHDDTLARSKSGKPVSVDLNSSLANLDADSDPDGWRAQVVIRDRQGKPVLARANAKFTLTPRVSLGDHHQFTDADTAAATWSMPLRMDDRGVASVTLPLRQSLRPAFGWSSAIAPSPFDQVGSRSRNRGRYRNNRGAFGRDNTVMTGDWQNRLGMPNAGVMKVRVSVPGSGVFEAVSQVWIRPPAVVGGRWPYQ